MNILVLILTCISLILNIISDIICIKSTKKSENANKKSEVEITCITAKTKFMEVKN